MLLNISIRVLFGHSKYSKCPWHEYTPRDVCATHSVGDKFDITGNIVAGSFDLDIDKSIDFCRKSLRHSTLSPCVPGFTLSVSNRPIAASISSKYSNNLLLQKIYTTLRIILKILLYFLTRSQYASPPRHCNTGNPFNDFYEILCR